MTFRCSVTELFEPHCQETYFLTCTPAKDSMSLRIGTVGTVFVVRMKKKKKKKKKKKNVVSLAIRNAPSENSDQSPGYGHFPEVMFSDVSACLLTPICSKIITIPIRLRWWPSQHECLLLGCAIKALYSWNSHISDSTDQICPDTTVVFLKYHCYVNLMSNLMGHSVSAYATIHVLNRPPLSIHASA